VQLDASTAVIYDPSQRCTEMVGFSFSLVVASVHASHAWLHRKMEAMIPLRFEI
jgi:hypothetical protein